MIRVRGDGEQNGLQEHEFWRKDTWLLMFMPLRSDSEDEASRKS